MSLDRPDRGAGSPEEWLAFAESDLRVAHLAAQDRLVLPEQVCFHAQQAAEKALKGVLRFQQVEFPRTHDIDELLRLAEESGMTLPEAVREAGFLTPYAVGARYPGYWDVISGTDVEEALRGAGQVLEWAKQVIAKTEGGDA